MKLYEFKELAKKQQIEIIYANLLDIKHMNNFYELAEYIVDTNNPLFDDITKNALYDTNGDYMMNKEV